MQKENIVKFSKILIPLFLIILILTLLLRREYESTDNAYLKHDITIIRPKVSGYLKEVLVQDNQRVEAGYVLARIDNNDFALKVVQAEASVLNARAQVRNLEAQQNMQVLNIKVAQAKLDSAQSNFDLFTKECVRAKELIKTNVISKQDFDQAINNYKKAKSAFDEASLNLTVSRQQLEATEAQLQSAKAQFQNSEASAGLAKIDLANTEIKAAVDGVVSSRLLQIGQLVSPSSALAYIVQNDKWVVANFKEVQTGKMRPGQEVTITVDSMGSKEFYGKVDSLSPATGAEFSILPPENATGNFTKIVQRVPVKIVFDKGQDLTQLRSGLSTFVKVKLD